LNIKVYDLNSVRRLRIEGNTWYASSFVGLFWFTNDYSDDIELVGEIEFTLENILNGQTILPEGSHANYKNRPRSSPIGKVELNSGKPSIFVGSECPDVIIGKIILFMGLKPYRGIIEINRVSYCDPIKPTRN